MADLNMIASHQVEAQQLEVDTVRAVWQHRKLVRPVTSTDCATRVTSAFCDRRHGYTRKRLPSTIHNVPDNAR
jgi:hypothetical protein